MKFKLAHTNINVTDMERSIDFYGKALGLRVVRSHEAADGSFRIVFLGDGESEHTLELTWLKDKEGPYDLGDNESHIALTVEDYAGAHALHGRMGCICYENEAMGIYFIEDPDGYWLEILPAKR
jgi:lactoylglutathione lyase